MAEEPNVPNETMRLPKKLIVLCDGTWQNGDVGWEKDHFWESGHPQVPTNVTRLARALNPEDNRRGQGHPQVVYYQAGVGSSDWNIGDKLLGGGLAYGLSENVREAYGFLVHNYMLAEDGQHDEIYLMGFSRGAFTARSVGGMIATLGLLTKHGVELFYYIFEDFENAGKDDYTPKLSKVRSDFKIDVQASKIGEYLAAYKAELIRLNLTRQVKIKAIAVFDTVGTLGLPIQPWLQKIGFPTSIHRYRFYDTGISDEIENAFQALALDEQRAAFNATVWEKQDGNKTNLKQVWFPGAHSNIGGGYEETGMATMALAWLMSQMDPFLSFNEKYLLEQFESNRAQFFTVDPKDTPTKTKPLWQWAMGTIYNGLSFPTNLAGSIIRTPGRYVRINYTTGKPDNKPKLLQQTNEYIHASVRIRKALAGEGPNGQKTYDPPALKGWKLGPGKGADGPETPLWTYSAKNDSADGKVMEEAPIGKFEALLLQKDAETQTRFAKLYPS